MLLRYRVRKLLKVMLCFNSRIITALIGIIADLVLMVGCGLVVGANEKNAMLPSGRWMHDVTAIKKQ